MDGLCHKIFRMVHQYKALQATEKTASVFQIMCKCCALLTGEQQLTDTFKIFRFVSENLLN